MNDSALSSEKKKPSRLVFAKWLVVALASAALTLLAVAIFVAVRRGPMEPLTAAGLQQAIERWQSQGAASYDIEIQVTGRQASRYRVEVRDGVPLRAIRNGQPLTQRRTWFTWTVPGMFETLRQDVRTIERHETGERGVPHLSVLVQFDPERGFPQRYVRVESVKMGGNPEITWQVTKFEIQH